MNEREPFDWATEGKVRPLPDNILVTDMEYGSTRTRAGLIIVSDDGRERGVRPRLATVYAVGDRVEDVRVGERVLISHGRWSRGVQVTNEGTSHVVRLVETESILLVAEP